MKAHPHGTEPRSIGFTKEDLQQRVVENIAAQLLGDTYSDDEDHSYIKASQLQRKLEELITERIDEVVKAQPRRTSFLASTR